MERVFWPNPPAMPLRFSLLKQARLGNPVILVDAIRPCPQNRPADVHAPREAAFVPRQRLVFGKHVQIPERQASRERDVAIFRRRRGVRRELDGSRRLEVPEDRGVSVKARDVDCFARAHAAGANAEQFDLGDDEAVAAAVLAHHAMKMCQAAEILDFLLRAFTAHAGVPVIVSFDETDHAATDLALEGAFCVSGVV